MATNQPFTNLAGDPYVSNTPAINYAHEWQKSGVQQSTAEVLSKIATQLGTTVPELLVQSAYRSPEYNQQVGGAKGSQHIQGNAIDLNLSGYTPEQKQAVLQTILAQPQINGIGVYDKNLNSLHFDTRDGPRVAWGPDYTTASLKSVTNNWVAPMVGSWLQGDSQLASVPMPNLNPFGPGGDWQQSSAMGVPQDAYAGPQGWALAGGFDEPIEPQVAGMPNPWNNYAPEPSAMPAAFQAVMEPPETKLGGGNEATKYFNPQYASAIPTAWSYTDPSGKVSNEKEAPLELKNLLTAIQGGDPAAVKAAFDKTLNAAGWAAVYAKGDSKAVADKAAAYFEELLAKSPGALIAAQAALDKNPSLYGLLNGTVLGQPIDFAPLIKANAGNLPPTVMAMPNPSPGFVSPDKAVEPIQVASAGFAPLAAPIESSAAPMVEDWNQVPSLSGDAGGDDWFSIASGNKVQQPLPTYSWEEKLTATGDDAPSSAYAPMMGDQLSAPHDPTHYQTSNPNNPWVQPGVVSGYEYIGSPPAAEPQGDDWSASVGMGPQFQDDYFEGPSAQVESPSKITQQPWNIITDGVGGLFYGLGLGGPQQASASPEPQYMSTIGQQPQPYNPGIGGEPDWMEAPPASPAQQQPNPWIVGGQGPQTGASPWITGQQGPNSGAWQAGQQGPPSAGNPWLVGGTPYQPPAPAPPPAKQAPPQQTVMAPSSPPPPPMPSGPSLGLQGIQSAVPSEYQQVSSYEAGEPGVYGAGAVISQDEFGNQYKTYESGNGETYTVSLGEGPGNSGYLLGEGEGGEQNEENGGGGKAALCSFYQRKGWLPKAVWKADTQFSKGFSPEMRAGYKMWARPLVAWMEREGPWATIVKWALWPIVRAWAHEMAHQWDPKEFPRGSVFGRFVLLTLGAVCSWLGQRRKVLA